MSRYFPLFVSLEGRRVLLFGAGSVAARRLDGLLRFGAEVTVIAPEVSPEVLRLLERYPRQTALLRRGYAPGDVKDAALVLSATDSSETDQKICAECREKGVPVNIASDQRLCDFYFPALLEHDGLVIGVSSGGEDHRKVRRFCAALRAALKGDKTTGGIP